MPASLLHGETEDELTASAEAVAAYAKAQQPDYPEDKGGGSSAAPVTRAEIEAEPDTRKRQALIAEHLDLFS